MRRLAALRSHYLLRQKQANCWVCAVMQAQQREAQAAKQHADQAAAVAKEQMAAAEADKRRCHPMQRRSIHETLA